MKRITTSRNYRRMLLYSGVGSLVLLGGIFLFPKYALVAVVLNLIFLVIALYFALKIDQEK